MQPDDHFELGASVRLLLSTVAGAALGLSYVDHRAWPLAWVGVGFLVVTALGARPGVAALCGFLHAFVFVLTCLFWIATVLKVHGGLSYTGGVGVLLLVAAAWGVLTGLFAWSVNRVSRRSVTRACLAAPFLWVTLEFVRDHLPEVGFPWNLLGYQAAQNVAFVQLATLTGIFGLSFLVAAYNALFAWVSRGSRESPARVRFGTLGGATVLLAVVALFGPRFVPQAPAAHYARTVQLNFPEVAAYESDWYRVHQAELDEIERLSLAPSPQHADIIVWPEVPAPFSFEDVQFAKRASSLAIRAGVPFLAGDIEWKPLAGAVAQTKPTRLVPYNSAILVDRQGQRVFVYDKIHLVPFGEYEPFPLIHHVVTSVSGDVGGFFPGSNVAVGTLSSGYRFGVFICYEAIFPGEIRRFAARGAQVFFNISNDGWFGRSAAPEQHLSMARVRAVENRRWLVRSTNNGYTVSVDPYGRIVERAPADIRTAADLPYDFRTDETLYTRWGDWFAWFCVLVSVAFLIFGKQKDKA